MRLIRIVLFAAFVCGLWTPAHSKDFVAFQSFPEPTGRLSIDAAQHLSESMGEPAKMLRIRETDKAHWLRADIATDNGQPFVLQLVPGSIDRVELFVLDERLEKQIQAPLVSGLKVHPDQWSVKEIGSYFAIDPGTHRNVVVFIRIETDHGSTIRLRKLSKPAYQIKVKRDLFLFAAFTGAVFMLGILTFSLAIGDFGRGYLWFFLAAVFLLLIAVASQGYGHRYLWGSYPDFSGQAVSFFAALFFFCYVTLGKRAIDPEPVTRFGKWGILGIQAVLLCTAILCYTGPVNIAVMILSLMLPIWTIVMSIEAFFAAKRGIPVGRWLLAGHICVGILAWIRMPEQFGMSAILGDATPHIEESIYMLLWTTILTFVYIGMNRSIVANHAKRISWQKDVIKKMERVVEYRTDELSKAKEESIRLGALQRDFLATMSHELRTPLASIIGMARMLKRNDQFDESLSRDMGIIERMSIHVLHMVDDGLDFVKGGKSDSTRQNKNVDMRNLVQDIIAIGRWLSNHQGNRYTFTRSKNMPSTLIFDEKKVRQIIINLISNAGRYCENGEIRVNLGYLAETPPTMTIDVHDNGRGMSEREVERFFEPFVKSRDSVGLGLGLAVTKRLIHDIDGNLRVKSNVGVGTQFQLSFPVETYGDDFVNSSELSERREPPIDVDSKPMPLLPNKSIDQDMLKHLKELVTNGQITEADAVVKSLINDTLEANSLRFLHRMKSCLDDLELDLLISQIDKIQFEQ